MQKKWTISLLFLVLLCGAKTILAQETADAAQQAIRNLQARIDQLETELAEIRSESDTIHGGKAPKTGTIGSTPPTPPPAPQLSSEQQMEA